MEKSELTKYFQEKLEQVDTAYITKVAKIITQALEQKRILMNDSLRDKEIYIRGLSHSEAQEINDYLKKICNDLEIGSRYGHCMLHGKLFKEQGDNFTIFEMPVAVREQAFKEWEISFSKIPRCGRRLSHLPFVKQSALYDTNNKKAYTVLFPNMPTIDIADIMTKLELQAAILDKDYQHVLYSLKNIDENDKAFFDLLTLDG